MKVTKKVLGILVVLAISAFVVSASMLTMYGKVDTKAEVSQSVLLDGANINGNVGWEHDLSIDAGCKKCFKHKLENQGCEQATIDVSHSLSVDYDPADYEGGKWAGLDVLLYDLSDHVLPEITTGYRDYWCGSGLTDPVDFTEEIEGVEDTYYGWEPLKIKKIHNLDCTLEFVIEMPRVMEDYDGNVDNFALAFDTDCDGIPDWQTGFNGEPGSHGVNGNWFYREYDNGWPTWESLPEFITGTTSDNQEFHIKILSDKLGNDNGKKDDCGLSYRFWFSGFLSSEGEFSSCGGNIFMGYPVLAPEDDGWSSSAEYEEETLGTLLGSEEDDISFTLDPNEVMPFCICYDFASGIVPGTYELNTEFLPSN